MKHLIALYLITILDPYAEIYNYEEINVYYMEEETYEIETTTGIEARDAQYYNHEENDTEYSTHLTIDPFLQYLINQNTQ